MSDVAVLCIDTQRVPPMSLASIRGATWSPPCYFKIMLERVEENHSLQYWLCVFGAFLGNCSTTSSFLEPGLCPRCRLPRTCWNLHAVLLPLGESTYCSLAKISTNVTNYSPPPHCHHSLDKQFSPTIVMPWFRFPRWDLLQRSNSISVQSWSCGWRRFTTTAHHGHKFKVWWKIMASQGGSRFALACSVFEVFCGLDQLPRHKFGLNMSRKNNYKQIRWNDVWDM